MIRLLILALLSSCAWAQVRVNVGGPQYTDSLGQVWVADTGCTSASTYSRTNPIIGTNDPTLYRTGRTDPSIVACTYPVTSPAFYTVTLLFAETDPMVTARGGLPNARPRVLNVFINDQLYWSQLNVMASSAYATAYTITSPYIAVTTGQITIKIAQVAYQAMLSGLDIENVNTNPPSNSTCSLTANPNVQGTTTAGIMEAVSLLGGPGCVSVPVGTFNISTTITLASGNGVCIQGFGQRGTILNWTGSSSGAIIDLNGPATPGGAGISNCFEHIQITRTNATNTNIGINVNNQASALIQDVALAFMQTPINIIGAISQNNHFRDIGIFQPYGDGVVLNTGLVAGYFDNINIACTVTNASSNGFHVIQDAGSAINNSYTVNCPNGFVATPGAGQVVKLMQLTNTYFDCGPGSGIVLFPATGGQVLLNRFIGTTTACQANVGVLLTGAGAIIGVSFLNHFSELNGQQGFYLLNGTDITFSDCYAMGNSTSNMGVYDGLAVDSTGSTQVHNIQIIGGMYGAYFDQPNTQRYGVATTSGTTGIHVQGIQAGTNLTGPFSDASTDQAKIIKDIDGTTIPTIASSTTLDPGPADPETIAVTGITTVGGILRGWNNRTITFVKPDSGSVTIVGATLTSLSTVTCKYVSGFTAWFCH